MAIAELNGDDRGHRSPRGEFDPLQEVHRATEMERNQRNEKKKETKSPHRHSSALPLSPQRSKSPPSSTALLTNVILPLISEVGSHR